MSTTITFEKSEWDAWIERKAYLETSSKQEIAENKELREAERRVSAYAQRIEAYNNFLIEENKRLHLENVTLRSELLEKVKV
jgi:hypothetical protein